MFEQFMSAAASSTKAKEEARRPAWPPNPFPKGPQPGSATEQILAALNQAHPRWLEHWELMEITGRSRGAIAWGLKYMQERGMVMSVKSARHPQFLRYRVVKEAGAGQLRRDRLWAREEAMNVAKHEPRQVATHLGGRRPDVEPPAIQDGMKDNLLNYAGLYEKLRDRAAP
jgi:hypothetical protein